MYGNVNRKKHPDGGYYRDYFYYACKHRTFVNGHKCTYRKQWSEDKINAAVEEVIRKLVNNPKFKKEIQKQRISVVLNANSSMICLYWNIGRAILQKQEEEGWGSKVIDRMAKDLKEAFPDMSGFSPRNIKYMRKFAECWPDFEIVQQVVAQIPWRTNRMLLDKLNTQEERLWYAHKTIENGYCTLKGKQRFYVLFLLYHDLLI